MTARDRKPNLLTTSDVARRLNISSNGVRYLERCGKLRAEFTTSGQRVFRPTVVEKLARARGVELEPPDAA